MKPNSEPLPSWMPRPAKPRASSSPSSTLPSRVEVCPPQAGPSSSVGWRGAVSRWLNQLMNRLPEQARPLNRLAMVKDEFLACLSDVQHVRATVVAERIVRARSMRELWHLRALTYNLLATTYSQSEAELRLGRLNHHFPMRATRQTATQGLDR